MTSTETAVFFIVFFIVDSILIDKSKKKTNGKKVIPFSLILAILIMTIIPAVQYSDERTDISNYIRSFYNSTLMSWGEFIRQRTDSVLFYGCGKLFSHMGGRILAFGFLAFIMSLAFLLFIKKEEPYISLFISSLVYFTGCYVTGSFNIFRQGIAICIIMFGFRFVYDRKLVKYIVCVIIAGLFHSTAFLCIVLYFIYGAIENEKQLFVFHGQNMAKYSGFIIIVCTILITIGYVRIIGFLTTNVSFLERYARYANEKASSNRDFYVNLLLLAIFFIFRKSLYKVDPHNRFMFILFACSCILGALGFNNPYVKRIAMYFLYPSEIILFGSLPYVFRKQNYRIISYILITMYLIGMFVFTRYIINDGWQYNYDLTNKPF